MLEDFRANVLKSQILPPVLASPCHPRRHFQNLYPDHPHLVLFNFQKDSLKSIPISPRYFQPVSRPQYFSYPGSLQTYVWPSIFILRWIALSVWDEIGQRTFYAPSCSSMPANLPIGHFTVVCLVARPLSGSEAGGDLVLIQTLLLFRCKLCCSHAN